VTTFPPRDLWFSCWVVSSAAIGSSRVIGASRVPGSVSSHFFFSRGLAKSMLCKIPVLQVLGFPEIQNRSGAAQSESALSFLPTWKLVRGGARMFDLGLGEGSGSWRAFHVSFFSRWRSILSRDPQAFSVRYLFWTFPLRFLRMG
jgi:hypothetical protein